ncbi:adenosine kinase [Pseudogemmobacter faecipullorum]|uniref:Adenosine kinase n=1 Tax=Pseudogemmobacter faecipullorum TaxID=2755041 RepID=A0ABS8CP54_9RHOB|nr:adenosine kinase [Pseudogemmobacter faecipullorum]MCB5411162.1 adenosine kinase [Pseudogemmobacter faecipullorum]
MKKYQVTGIGNAIVDVISPADEAFLARNGIEKGIMQLVDQARGEALYSAMANRVQAPGGSVANSIAGIGALGLPTAFIGRVCDDSLGRFYARGLAAEGTDFVNPPVAGGELPTSRCMIFVSPDGERSMNTYLGISSELGPEDVSEAVVSDTEVLLIEGYLYDKDKGKAALERAAALTRAAGGQPGVSLSDPFCVDRHRDDFRRLIKGLTYVIGNEYEWQSLYQSDLDTALQLAAADVGLVVCTRSGEGVELIRGAEKVTVPVSRITPVDTTGAGDQFAAGFLFGLASGASLEVAGRMGCVAAGEVISHYGARPGQDIKALFRANGLI